jgi:signal transduction histidine kinase
MRGRHFDSMEDEAVENEQAVRTASVAAFFQLLAIWIDKWHDKWLAPLSNFQLIAGVVALLVAAHIATTTLFWSLSRSVPEWLCQAMGAFTAILFGVPIVAFGLLEYRRAHDARRRFQRVVRQLIAARDEAQRASETKSHFLASMSHELRTPLNAIIGFSEILKTEAFGPLGMPRYIEYAADIHHSGQHLLSLVNDILDLSKIEAGVEHINTNAPVDLTAKIEAICRTMSVIATENGTRLTSKLPPEPVHILANRRMMAQVLMNLISNAIKFSHEAGIISVALTLEENGDVVVEVSDTGIGMTRHETEIALIPFSQIDSHHSRRHAGTGLGLPLVKAMVELHGGHLSIISKPGIGTTTRFTIPHIRVIAEATDETRMAQEVPESPRKPLLANRK